MITMTSALLETLKTESGGFTGATVEAIGLQWSALKNKGWTSDLIGKQFTEEQIQRAREGRTIFRSRKAKRDQKALSCSCPFCPGHSLPVLAASDADDDSPF